MLLLGYNNHVQKLANASKRKIQKYNNKDYILSSDKLVKYYYINLEHDFISLR